MEKITTDWNKIVVVILAGGSGTRIAHVLKDIPKPMAVVKGRPFIEWIIRFLTRCGAINFRISTGYLGNVIESYFQGGRFPRANICCIRERMPSGTAGGFRCAVAGLNPQPAGYLVVNGDSLLLADPGALIAMGCANAWQASLFGVKVDDASRYGTLEVDDSMRLRGFREKCAGKGLVNAGVYWFSADCLSRFSPELPLSFERDVFPALLRDGVPVGVVPVRSPFIDIGTPASLNAAEAFISDHVSGWFGK